MNTRIVHCDTDIDVVHERPLAVDTRYDLLVDIGPHRSGSLLQEVESRWPDDMLPTGELLLRAVLMMNGHPSQTRTLRLPARGASLACDCPEGPHTPDCVPHAAARFPLHTPEQPDAGWGGELVIYYEVVAVHAQRLHLPVATDTHDGLHARLLYRLTESFADLGPLRSRLASFFVPAVGARAIVNGLSFLDNPVSITPAAANNAVRSARQLLYERHLLDSKDGPLCVLDARHGKTDKDFCTDLAILARHGAEIYTALFRDNILFDTLPDLIRHESRARARSVVLSVADAALSTDPATPSVPWSLVYDLPMPGDPQVPFSVCPSVRRFGPGGNGEPIPAHCPEPDHRGPVLCPFGFWGLSCVIEQPPSTSSPVDTVLRRPEPMSVFMAYDPDLDSNSTDQHIVTLVGSLGARTMQTLRVSDLDILGKALAEESMDIVYLYCHGGYSSASAHPLARPGTVLQFGRRYLHPLDIGNWRREHWPIPHWPNRKPLIMLNGCHTAALTSETLSNFVESFVVRAEGAALIGTEVTLEQGMAGWFGALLLTELTRGATAGVALRGARWAGLQRGNVMGLAYTLHGLADLRLRATTDSLTKKEIH
ncbi:hypothetical protein [Nocardia tenerifensis]|uniref:hypothetical protein n=1 Tax=Nocardia tenerifensis TaxID=228006 RepID=UPI00059384FC|nr:hypothetical protein [Nocardia tenerifensis]